MCVHYPIIPSGYRQPTLAGSDSGWWKPQIQGPHSAVRERKRWKRWKQQQQKKQTMRYPHFVFRLFLAVLPAALSFFNRSCRQMIDGMRISRGTKRSDWQQQMSVYLFYFKPAVPRSRSLAGLRAISIIFDRSYLLLGSLSLSLETPPFFRSLPSIVHHHLRAGMGPFVAGAPVLM